MSIARLLAISLLVAACGSDLPPGPTEVPASPSSPPTSLPTPSNPRSSPPAPAPTSVPSPPRTYELGCGDLELADCEARASEVTASVSEQHPGKTIVSLRFYGPSGSYHLAFDDGTVLALIVN